MRIFPAVSRPSLGAGAFALALIATFTAHAAVGPRHQARETAQPSSKCPRGTIPATALSLTFVEFDQSSAGWRFLADRGCYRGAAAVIRRYIAARSAALTPPERAILYFHLAQMLASTGDRTAALSALDLSQRASAQQSKRFASWDVYVQGTIAFLRQDRRSLIDAITGLEETAAGQAGTAKLVTDLNLATLRGLRDCFAKDYSVAYSSECAVGRPHVSLPPAPGTQP